jgi:hypothetical protein
MLDDIHKNKSVGTKISPTGRHVVQTSDTAEIIRKQKEKQTQKWKKGRSTD